MKNDNSIGKLGEIMPDELTENSDVILSIKETSVQNFLDNEHIDEKTIEDRQQISHQKRIIKRPKQNVFLTTEKENNGMVEQFNEITIWRENILLQCKDARPNKSAIELILYELQTHFKDKKDISNIQVAKFMGNKYRKTVAFGGGSEKVGKYVVQMMSKISKAFGNDKSAFSEVGLIDKPLITVSRVSGSRHQSYNCQEEFFKHTPATLRCVVSEHHKISSAELTAIKYNIKSDERIKKTIPETTPDLTGLIEDPEPIVKAPESIKSDPKPIVKAPQPTEQNSNYIVNSILDQVNIVDLIEKVVDRGGSIRINNKTFEINMTRGGY